MTNQTINDGGPAFPEIRIVSGDNYNPVRKLYYNGMTLRDYFAAKVMHAMLSTPKEMQATADDIAEMSYEMADAMIKARNNK